AEDVIRYFHVTGVQTCALPIFLGKERFVFVDARREDREELGDLVLIAERRVHRDAADPDVAGRQASTTDLLEEVHDDLSLAEAEIGRASWRGKVECGADLMRMT